jgi:conjugative relaxase-like TrwC/TraI family protein
MLSVGNVDVGGVDYYTSELAESREDYYTGHGEAPGRWAGRLASEVGLRGQVNPETFHRLLSEGVTIGSDGREHTVGVSQGAGNQVSVRAVDLTFSPDKTFSALHAMASPEVQRRMMAVHHDAVRLTMGRIEADACITRRGKGGVRSVDGDGMVWAEFDHRTSRAGDPQVHTHVVVANRTRAEDGRWLALEGGTLRQAAKGHGQMYQALVRAGMVRELGVSYEAVGVNGQAGVEGMADLCAGWSKRHTQIVQAADERKAELVAQLGRSLSVTEERKIEKVAVIDTRATKDPNLNGDDTSLYGRFRAEAAGAGWTWERAAAEIVGQVQMKAWDDPDRVVEEAYVRLSERASFYRWEIRGAVAASLDPAAEGSAEEVAVRIDGLTAQLEADSRLRDMSADLEQPAGVEVRASDGRPVTWRPGLVRFTTEAAEDRQERLAAQAVEGRGRMEAAQGGAVASAVEGLSEDQVEAVRRITGTDRVTALIGPAGAGKTRTLGAVVQVADAEGWGVVPVAYTGKASQELAASIGREASTVDSLLKELDDGRLTLGGRDVLVVDEAGMVSDAKLDRLLDHAERNQTRVVVAGDHHQLAPVEGVGGGFAVLAEENGVELESVHRFRADWEAAASLRLRDGDSEVLDVYAQHDRLREGGREQMEGELLADYLSDRGNGARSLMVVDTNDEARRLAGQAQQWRAEINEVDLSRTSKLREGAVAGRGDEVRTRHNDRRLRTTGGSWVANGDTWEVTAVRDDGGLMARSLSGRGVAHLPPDYLTEHAELAYAGTTETTQGGTVDRSRGLLSDRADRPDVYIAMSRGRETNVAYVITDGDPTSEYARAAQLDGHEVLRGALSKESGAAGSIRTEREEIQSEVIALNPIERAHQAIAQRGAQEVGLAAELGVDWDPDASGPAKARQVLSLRQAAREQDRTRDLPGGRQGMER